jgi:hypothetical protein
MSPAYLPEAIGTVDAAIFDNYSGFVNEHREFKDLLFGKFEGVGRERASPVPENYERIVELNRAGQLPEGDPAELQAESYRFAAG